MTSAGSNKKDEARILSIVRGTTVDGPGLRTSIYFAGCDHRCEGCHNPQSWDFGGGSPMSLADILEIVEEEDFDVTLSGGDPLYNPGFVSALVDGIRRLGHTVWIYTGFTWEEITADPELQAAVSGAEAVVEGRFVASLRDPDLRFRGSSNQRIIYIKETQGYNYNNNETPYK